MHLLDSHSLVYMSVTPAQQNDSTCASPIGGLSFIDASGRQFCSESNFAVIHIFS